MKRYFYQDAIEDFNKAIAPNPDHAEAYFLVPNFRLGTPSLTLRVVQSNFPFLVPNPGWEHFPQHYIMQSGY
jgi:hypothetical protein